MWRVRVWAMSELSELDRMALVHGYIDSSGSGLVLTSSPDPRACLEDCLRLVSGFKPGSALSDPGRVPHG